MSVITTRSTIGAIKPNPFSTAHLMGDLKGRSVRGGAVTLAAQGAKFALQLGSTAVLARLLTPADFGLIAMVTAVTGFVAMFKDAGLSMATVQRESITHEQISTLFWINVALSASLMAVTAALAPAISWFYGEPRLTGITLVLAGSFLFGGLTVQHQALLQRQMRFPTLSGISVTIQLAGIVSAIAAASAGWGYWSLVVMTVVQSAANAALVWISSGWIPGPPRRGAGIRPMLKFGGNLTAASLLVYLRRNADNVLIGAVWGSSALGLYAKAYHLLLLPVRQVNQPISAVAIPTLCRLYNEPVAYRRYYRRFLEAITCIGLPLVLFAGLESRRAIGLLLGPQWLDAAIIFEALSPAALVSVWNVAGGVVYISSGRASRQLMANLYCSIIVVASLFLALPYGVIAVAAACSASMCFCFPFVVAYAYRGTPLSSQDFFQSVWRPICAATAAGLTSFAFGRMYPVGVYPVFLELSGLALIFGCVYAVTYAATPGGLSFVRSVGRGFGHGPFGSKEEAIL